ncbi:MAG: hypothetical protein V2I56_25090 [Desulfobacteraceae bacterium]|jgi:hypothetical protein|nr:hypothetical protein [Desulfobacteraceae bacterium]
MTYTRGTPKGSTAVYTYLNRRSLIKLVGMVALGSGLWISACDHPSVDPPQKTAATENKTMKSVLTTADMGGQIPPLDLSQPQEVKTATFALG